MNENPWISPPPFPFGGEPNTLPNSPRFQEGEVVRLNLEHPDVAAAATDELLHVPAPEHRLCKLNFARVLGSGRHPATGEWWCCVQALYGSDLRLWMLEDWFARSAQQDPSEIALNTVAAVSSLLVPNAQISVAGQPFNLKLLPSCTTPPQQSLDLSEPIPIHFQW